jgi:hypothetical protein
MNINSTHNDIFVIPLEREIDNLIKNYQDLILKATTLTFVPPEHAKKKTGFSLEKIRSAVRSGLVAEDPNQKTKFGNNYVALEQVAFLAYSIKLQQESFNDDVKSAFTIQYEEMNKTYIADALKLGEKITATSLNKVYPYSSTPAGNGAIHFLLKVAEWLTPFYHVVPRWISFEEQMKIIAREQTQQNYLSRL